MEEYNESFKTIHLGPGQTFEARNVEYVVPRNWGCLAVTREAADTYDLKPISSNIVYGERAGHKLIGVGNRIEVVLIGPSEAGFGSHVRVVDDEGDQIHMLARAYTKARTLRLEVGCDLTAPVVQDELETITHTIQEEYEGVGAGDAPDASLLAMQAQAELFNETLEDAVENGLTSHYERRRQWRVLRSAIAGSVIGPLALLGSDVMLAGGSLNVLQTQDVITDGLLASTVGFGWSCARLYFGILSAREARDKTKERAHEKAFDVCLDLRQIMNVHSVHRDLETELRMLTGEEDS